MSFYDLFKPYSPEIFGDLESYLKEHIKEGTENSFYGPEYFFILKEKNILIPNQSIITVNLSPSPDVGYLVNPDFLLKSNGTIENNMSLVAAKKGIYEPHDILKERNWLALSLNL